MSRSTYYPKSRVTNRVPGLVLGEQFDSLAVKAANLQFRYLRTIRTDRRLRLAGQLHHLLSSIEKTSVEIRN